MDEAIDVVVKAASKNKRMIVTVLLVLVAVFSARVLDYVQGNITKPVQDALAAGISASKFGTAVALGATAFLSMLRSHFTLSVTTRGFERL